MVSVSTVPTEGAPSLRFLQGWAAMLRVLRDLLWWRYQTPSTHAFRLPPLQRTQERGTHCVADADKIKSLGHPPFYVNVLTNYQFLRVHHFSHLIGFVKFCLSI